MVIVRTYDKRCIRGFSIKFFQTDVVTPEVVEYVRTHKKAYWVETKDAFWHTREDFFAAQHVVAEIDTKSNATLKG